ncbi:CLUMA_CG009672, isoform A [Clunio marinus]|uniref:CLUMA_CG009672, isoform A n=1 Tax=Clunio marinus TaxID=568069 RepID=A0A1J1I7I4_9DIPT|nr:CLUMA_CG009672, isoform A [Clunio marinus]
MLLNVSLMKSLNSRGYYLEKKIGQGSFGSVYQAFYRRRPYIKKKQKLACKTVNGSEASEIFLNKFLPREVEVLCLVKHQYIAEIHSILQCQDIAFIFMAFAENGDLLKYLTGNGKVDEPQSRIWFSQMVSAIKYLHSLHYAHRDIKCENILISKEMNIRITDFAYIAPEILQHLPYDPLISDVWALGIVLTIMLFNDFPFEFGKKSMFKVLKNIRQKNVCMDRKIATKLSADCLKTINKILEPNPTYRPSINEVAGMPFIIKNIIDI